MKTSIRVLCLGAPIVLATACNALLGIDDPTVSSRNDAGDGAVASDAADSATSDGANDAPVDAGSDSDAGDSGSTGDGGAIAQSLEGYWPLDGDGTDHSGKGRNLTLAGSPPFAAGLVGSALALTGNANQFATAASTSAFDFPGPFSLQIWVRYNALTSEQTLLEKFVGQTGPGWSLTTADNTKALFIWGATKFVGPSGTGGATVSTWHQVFIRRGASGFDVFFDSVSVGSAADETIPTSSSELLIGRRNPADGRGGFPVDGKLDEIAIWSRALETSEIEFLYNAGAGRAVVP